MTDKYVFSGEEKVLKSVLPLFLAYDQRIKELEATIHSSRGNRPPINPDFDDYLLLTVCWSGKVVSKEKYHYVEKSVRLKGINARTIALEPLQELARRVKTKFNNLIFNTGHCRVKYANYKDGFKTWGDFENKETGYRVIEALGDIIGKSINTKLLRYEYVYDPSGFDATPEKILVANQLVRPPVDSPIAVMKFTRATLLFPWIGHVEILCDKKGFIISNLDFLKQYED